MSRKIDFSFRQFDLAHNRCEMKVGTDAVLLGSWVSLENAQLVLDIGCGCGIIAMMIAQRCNSCSVDAVERNRDAAEQAKENVSHSPFSGRINVVHESLQNFSPDKKYSLIVSNPPFFENSLLSPAKERNVVRHAIELSLNDIFSFCEKFLLEEGKISLVLPCSALNKVLNTAAEFSFFPYSVCKVRSHTGKNPNRILISFSKYAVHPEERELVLFEHDRVPTSEYKDLTKDFYIHF